ncbi:MAG TPA: hypothetical protein VGE34_04280 [Candidatus Saccharimonadales bacterium]
MLELVQHFSLIIFGFVVVIILSWILVLVHRQSNRVKDLEQRINLTDKAREAEVDNG